MRERSVRLLPAETAGDASVMAYIGRSGWNSLRIGGAIPASEVLEAIDASYDAVVSRLPRKERPAPP
jgi:predicted DNA-binding protein (MmcQ/YjbR family)